MNREILSLLRILSDGTYHSAQSLADRVKIPVQSIASILSDSNYLAVDLIQSSDNCYCWKNPIQWLDKNAILAKQKKINIDLHLLDHIDSTNSYLNQLKKKI